MTPFHRKSHSSKQLFTFIKKCCNWTFGQNEPQSLTFCGMRCQKAPFWLGLAPVRYLVLRFDKSLVCSQNDQLQQIFDEWDQNAFRWMGISMNGYKTWKNRIIFTWFSNILHFRTIRKKPETSENFNFAEKVLFESSFFVLIRNVAKTCPAPSSGWRWARRRTWTKVAPPPRPRTAAARPVTSSHLRAAKLVRKCFSENNFI